MNEEEKEVVETFELMVGHTLNDEEQKNLLRYGFAKNPEEYTDESEMF